MRKDTMQRMEPLGELATMWPKIVLKHTAIPTPKHAYINLSTQISSCN